MQSLKVLVTGAGGHLAQALLPRLCADARINRVTGIDVRPARFTHLKFRFVARDIRDPALGTDLAGADAVVHLAFVVLQRPFGRRRMRDINVNGTARLAAGAHRAQGIKTFVHVSSAAVYAPKATPIRESDRMAALRGFGYAEDKIAAEAQLDTLATQTAMRVVRLRPHVILGPSALPYLKALLRLPFYPDLAAPRPRLQCVHEDDVVEAIRLALFGEARGGFNLAGDGAVSYRDLARALHQPAVPLPFGLARAALASAWLAGIGTHPAWLAGLRENLVLDTRRAREDLGWRPRYDTIEAARAAIRPHAHGRGVSRR